jgi:hypothetical protein
VTVRGCPWLPLVHGPETDRAPGADAIRSRTPPCASVLRDQDWIGPSSSDIREDVDPWRSPPPPGACVAATSLCGGSAEQDTPLDCALVPGRCRNDTHTSAKGPNFAEPTNIPRASVPASCPRSLKRPSSRSTRNADTDVVAGRAGPMGVLLDRRWWRCGGYRLSSSCSSRPPCCRPSRGRPRSGSAGNGEPWLSSAHASNRGRSTDLRDHNLIRLLASCLLP